MKLFVTGGAGFIGSNFIRHVLSLGKGYEIINFDKLTYAGNLANLDGCASPRTIRFVKGDICDASAVQASMRGCDAVVHFAAESHVDRSIYEPAPVIETNVVGTFTLLQVWHARCASNGSSTYRRTKCTATCPPEFSPMRIRHWQPSSPYSASKAASDLLVRSYVRTYGFPAVITRSSNAYGPYQFPEKFLPLIIANALDDKAVPIYGDGGQQRNWVHVADNCDGVLAVLERGRVGEVYNIGGLDVVDNLTVARQVLRLMGKPESLLSYVKDRPGHDRRYALNWQKMREGLGWKPLIRLEEGLRQTIQWYERNSEWLAGVRGGIYRSYYEKYYEKRESALLAIIPPAPSGRSMGRRD